MASDAFTEIDPHPIPSTWPKVPTVEAPSPQEFARCYLRTGMPVIVRGIVETWPAQRRWTFDFLRAAHGDATLSAYVAESRRMVATPQLGLPVAPLSIADALDRLGSADGVHLSCWVEDLPAALHADIVTPAYCEVVPWLRRRFWITSAGMVTQAHQDPYDNLFGVMEGAKRFILVPPRPRRAMYPHSPFSSIPNFSQVDPETPDLTRFPSFRRASPLVAEVEAGDLLFIPNLWWHQVRALRPTLALNFFWSRGWMVPLTRLAAIYRRLRKI